MPELLDFKNLEDIITSYETRIEKVSFIFNTTYLILNDFQESILNTKEERESSNSQLRDVLAQNEHLRRKDFDRMMQDLLSVQDENEKEARNLLKSYLNEQKQIAQALKENLKKFRDFLARGEAQRVKEYHELIKEVFTKQDEMKKEVTHNLKAVQKEQRLVADGLKGLLAKGRELRIKDLKAMLKEFKNQREMRLSFQRENFKNQRETRLTFQRERKEEVNKMLDSFKKARQKLHSP